MSNMPGRPREPSIIGMSGPYTSESMIPTAAPACRSATARFTATVDLPTPPLPEETAIVCRTSGIRSAAGGGAGAWPAAACRAGGGAPVLPIFTCTFATPGSWPTSRAAMLCIVARDLGDWVVNASVKDTWASSPIARSCTSPSATMSSCCSGSRTPLRAPSTASRVTIGATIPPE